MSRRLALVVLVAVALPIVLRLIWFFPGFSLLRRVATPDYSDLKMPAAPVSTPALWDVKKTGGVVVVDDAHANQYQSSEVQTLFDGITERGAMILINSDASTLSTDLKSASAYVVISPSITFTVEEVRQVQDFVGRGGRLVAFADATRGIPLYDFSGNPVGNDADVNNANPLLEPFGISVNADYLYNLVTNDGNFRNVYLQLSPNASLLHGVQKVVFYGTHSVETDTGSPLLLGDAKTFSSLTDATPPGDPQKVWAGAAVSHDGNVLAFGDFTFLMPPYNTVADNAPLINNVADFLLGGKRTGILADYPYIFRGRSVDIVPTSGVQMTAEIIGALAGLQSGLRDAGVQTAIVQDPPSGVNRIVLGTFSPTDDLAPYVKPFGLASEELGEYIELQPFGKIGRSGTGLLLLSPGESSSTLVLLADSVDDLTTLIGNLGSGDLSACVLQGNTGACSIGFGGAFSEATPTPVKTPTPQAPG